MLVRVDSNPVSPKTEIEDALDGKVFLEALKEFIPKHPELQEIIDGCKEPTDEPSFFALDLSPSKQKVLETFFKFDNNKFAFAEMYVSKIDNESSVPDWIKQLRAAY